MARESQVLYRKYRPQVFSEVLGQEHIVSVLESSIKNNNFAHAYLFTGSRGTGKTSVARILARALNTNPEDIIEIDAASNRGIDDIRALRDAVRTLPFSSPFKVYIIDEVHMLSKDAWGALLKTLEEPPSHVVFVLATTEVEKVPETISSRCQVFSFKKPSEKVLIEMIHNVAKKEKIKIDEESANLVAFLGDGSFRDTYGILQKVFSFSSDRNINREIVERVTGAPTLKIIGDIYNALVDGNLDNAYKALKIFSEQESDISILIKLLLQTVRLSLMYRYAPSVREEIEKEYSEQYKDLIVKGAIEGAKNINANSIVSLIDAMERVNYASVPSLPLEIAFIEILGETSK